MEERSVSYDSTALRLGDMATYERIKPRRTECHVAWTFLEDLRHTPLGTLGGHFGTLLGTLFFVFFFFVFTSLAR